MTRESVVFTFGVFIFLMPYLGVPETWKFYFYTIAGLLLVMIGYSLRRSTYLRRVQNAHGERNTDSFAEHTPEHTDEPKNDTNALA